MKKILVALGLMATLAACNTVEGFGQDLSAGARTVNDAF
jgi:predicted small secreted protein